jgi:hypothetical protein
MLFDGAPEDCVSRYFSLHTPRTRTAAAAAGRHADVDPAARAAIEGASVLSGAKSRHGNRDLEVVAAAVTDGHGARTWDFEMMHRACVRVLLRANGDVAGPSAGIQIHDRIGSLVFAAGTPQLHFALAPLQRGQEIMLEFRIALNLQPGAYTLSIDAAEYDSENPNVGTFYDRIGGLGPLNVGHSGSGALPFYGAAQLPMEISYA